MARYSVLMVCTANICRSPMAAGLLIEALQREGLAKEVRVDSAGTHALRGQRPDARAQKVVRTRGGNLQSMKARQFRSEDFQAHDLILCMDNNHHAALIKKCPEEYRDKVALIMDFAPQLEDAEVPDPYYGNVAGFERVADLLEAAVGGITRRIRAELV